MKIQHIDNLDNKEIVVKNQYHFRSPKNLPSVNFLCGICGSRGSGKSNVVCNINKFYKGCFNSIHLVCPNYSNELKLKQEFPPSETTFIYTEPNDETAIQILNYVKEQVAIYKKYLKDLKKYRENVAIYYKYISEDIDKLTDYEWMKLDEMNYTFPEKPICKYSYYPTSLVILDDCMNTDLFRRKSPFTNMQIRNRHLFMSIIVVSQSYKSILRAIRQNMNWVITFKVNDMKLCKDIFDENGSMFKDFDEFVQALAYATDKPYNFLYIDKSNNEVRKNFNERIILE